MKRPIDELSKASKKARMATATGLIRSETAALRAMKQAIRVEANRLTVRLASMNPDDVARLRMELHRQSKELQSTILASLNSSNRHTIKVASGSVQATANGISDELVAYGVPVAASVFDLVPYSPTETVGLAVAADALAVSWFHIGNSKLQDGVPPHKLAQETTDAWITRVDRTVVTETARSFNEALDDGSQQLAAKVLPGTPAHALLFKRWDALLDRRTCHICSNLDNEIVPLDAPSFRGGNRPGEVHPMCRCISIPCAHQYDLNVAKMVSREVFGPGVGRAAENSRRENWEDSGGHLPGHRKADPSHLTAEENRRWLKLYKKALHDEEYRARLLHEEVRRHETSQKLGTEVASPKAPRVSPKNDMARDRRSPRELYEQHLGRQIGEAHGHIIYGEISKGRR